MRNSFGILAAVSALLVACAAPAPPARAAIMASGDTSKPSTITNYSITGQVGGPSFPSVSFAEDIILSAAAGPWHANLINNVSGSPPQIPSGNPVAVLETLANLGGVPWTQWSEKVVTR